MADKSLSLRSQRRLRQQLSVRMAEECRAKRLCLTSHFSSTEAGSLSETATSDLEELSTDSEGHEGDLRRDAGSPSDTTTSDLEELSTDSEGHEGDLRQDAGSPSDTVTSDLEELRTHSEGHGGDLRRDAGSPSEMTTSDLEELSTEEEYDDDELSSICTDDDTITSKPVFLPLFENSRISSHHFRVMFMSIAQKHNLTISSQSDILRFLNLTMPAPNRVPSSFRTVETGFVNYKAETIIHRYCGKCLGLLTCPGSSCSKEACALSTMQQDAVFVELPLANQLKERFEGESSLNICV